MPTKAANEKMPKFGKRQLWTVIQSSNLWVEIEGSPEYVGPPHEARLMAGAPKLLEDAQKLILKVRESYARNFDCERACDALEAAINDALYKEPE